MKHYLMGGLALLALSACATKPAPVQDNASQRQSAADAPNLFEPIAEPEAVAPLPPAVEKLPEATAPVVIDPNLPSPGSIEDFAFQSGGEPRVFFSYDQYDLSSEARDVLRRQADWMNRYPNASAVIEGHADERGTREYNLALGARRADSVQAFLISQGVSPRRLRTLSYGKERPIDGRPSESGWARNRNGYTDLRLNGSS